MYLTIFLTPKKKEIFFTIHGACFAALASRELHSASKLVKLTQEANSKFKGIMNEELQSVEESFELERGKKIQKLRQKFEDKIESLRKQLNSDLAVLKTDIEIRHSQETQAIHKKHSKKLSKLEIDV